MAKDQKDHEAPSGGRWTSVHEVKGTAADLRKSSDHLREQVAKDLRIYSRDTHNAEDKKKG